MHHLADLLACPRCDTALNDLACPACRVTFPRHGGLPWLFADPGAAISDWKNRYRLAVEHLQADLERVQQALTRQPGPATRRRLDALARGYRAQRQHLESILRPLELARGGSLTTLLALRTRLPPALGILGYAANLHRDWCWGDEECRTALGDVMTALERRAPQRILVLGAGAGRLAYDLHQSTRAQVTVALDVNPLLMQVGAAVSQGASVKLVEFPLAPRCPEAAAVERTLRAPAASRPGLEFLLADAHRAPFRSGSFDLVVTPWLLDVMDAPVADALARINALLAADGIWINHGSTAFDDPDPAQRLTLEELLEVAAHTGFANPAVQERTMRYMDCPDSRHGRQESVVTLQCRKAAPAAAPPRHQALPDWIVPGRTPIPALAAFRTQAMTTRMHAFLMTLIDGQRSLQDMAGVLEAQQLMSRGDAEAALRGFLSLMHEEAGRSGRPAL